MTLSSSPPSDSGLPQLSAQGSPSPADAALQAPEAAAAAAAQAAAAADPTAAPRKLAILGLPWETCEDALRTHFSQYGAVEATEVMRDRLSGKSRGFGFVTFADAAAAAAALAAAEHTIDGRRCEAKVALPKTAALGDGAAPGPAAGGGAHHHGRASSGAAPLAAGATTRIFVARIPQSVTDVQFRAYFERYGRLQDAYMPRDHSRQAYRGIGFVTFATPDSVERVMASKHWLNGHEVAIDRATPKDDGVGGRRGSTGVAGNGFGAPGRHSFDNGAGMVGPGLTPLTSLYQQQLTALLADPAGLMGGMRLSEDQQRDLSAAAAELATNHFNAAAAAAAAAAADFNAAAAAAAAEQACNGGGSPLLPPATTGLLCGLGADGGDGNGGGGKPPSAVDASAAATAAAAAAMAAMAPGMVGGPMGGPLSAAQLGLLNAAAGLPPGMAPPPHHHHHHHHHSALKGLPAPGAPPPPFMGAGAGAGGFGGADAFGVPPVFGPGATVPPKGTGGGGGRRSVDSTGARRSLENPAIQSVRAGPRIFIGKLTKETSEADVREYFGRFGFVLDVYMPKARDNKAEHRGFGFVTFETDAAIKRVVGAGTHKLKGSTIAIDIAMPKLDEELPATAGGGGGGVAGSGPASCGAGAAVGGSPGGAAAGGDASGPLEGPASCVARGNSAGSNSAQFDAVAAGMMAAAAAAQQFSARASLQMM